MKTEVSRVVLLKTVAPFHDLHLGHDTSFELEQDTYLAPIPDWLRNDEAILKRLSQRDQDDLAACTHCFLSEYEGDESTELLASRLEKETYRSPKGQRSDQVYLANLAMWLGRLPSIGFNLVFHARGNNIFEPPHQHDRFLYLPDDETHRRRNHGGGPGIREEALYGAL